MLSLIVSTYNRPDLLRKALLAVGAQSLPPGEVIIADDGSREDMISSIRPLLPELGFRVILVTQADLGFRAARNRNNALRIASGDRVLSIDQDIVMPHDYVKTFAESLRPGEWFVSWPVRLTEGQSTAVTEEAVRKGACEELPTTEQLLGVRRQLRKDRFYFWLHRLGLRPIGPKLRSGVFGAWREDLLAVNGFDESYKGWGNEDDDLGHRLHRYGARGRHIALPRPALHLYHPSHNARGARANREYYLRRLGEIRRGDFRAAYGIDRSLGDDPPTVLELT
jgi:glycosyltransferase involved in cell wall biosynthesis